MRRGVWLAVLALAATLALAPRAAASPLPSDFFGVSSPDLVPMTAAQRDATMADQRAAGVRLLRQLFDWDQIETTEGNYDWADMDGFVASAARAGMKVLPVVLWSPHWASNCPDKDTYRNCPPADPAVYGNFVATLIGRYGPNGSFWSSNPTVPKVPITAWQLWNEPALPVYWGGSGATPSAAEYVDLLKGAAPIIRAADPNAEIVAAGIPQSTLKGAIPMTDYVNGMYAAGVKGVVDDIALHLYAASPAEAVGFVEQVRSIMNANGDSATPIWATEWGWASAGKVNKFVTDLPGQAANTDALMAELVARHEELNIRAMTEYFWHDGSDQSNTTDRWDNHLGLVFQDYSHKPAYNAFLGRAIDTTPPDTSAAFTAPDSIGFSSTEAGSDFECNLDDTTWSACTSPEAVGGQAPGNHSLAVRATDPYGNTDPSTALVSWQVPRPQAAAVKGVTVTAPSLPLGPLKRTLRRLNPARLAHRRTLRLTLTWPAAGRITLTLRAHGVVLARGSRVVNHAGRAGLVLKLRGRGRRLLAHSKRLNVSLTEQFASSDGGQGAGARGTFVLRRR
jgi:hypothetical protein